MLLRLNQDLSIEDLRNHPPEIVEKLREALLAGAAACEDPHRESFYEVGSDGRVFYICISPITRAVLLLGSWPTEEAAAGLASQEAAAD
jgi:hypothetical protein